MNMTPSPTDFLMVLQNLIDSRKVEMPENSYTAKLFQKGINKIAQKVGEEAVELIIEAKDQNRELFLNEAADLMYHFLVLLSARDCRIEEVMEVLKNRHKG
jgi:phosphoribosyl-AMP cyclohydrolase / phosphoribosyl-ATP pyrophosphohydrolase